MRGLRARPPRRGGDGRRRRPAGRATAAGAGIVQPWASAATGPYYDLYARGAAHYPAFVDQLAALGSTELGYRRSGSLGRERRRRRDRRRHGRAARADGVPRRRRWARRAARRRRAGSIGSRRCGPGCRECGSREARGWTGGCSSPVCSRHRTTRRHRAATARWRCAAPADRVVADVDGERLAGDRLVVAGGAWAGERARPAGAAPGRGAAARADRPPPSGGRRHGRLADGRARRRPLPRGVRRRAHRGRRDPGDGAAASTCGSRQPASGRCSTKRWRSRRGWRRRPWWRHASACDRWPPAARRRSGPCPAYDERVRRQRLRRRRPDDGARHSATRSPSSIVTGRPPFELPPIPR